MFYEKFSNTLALPQEVRALMATLQTKLGDLPELQDKLFEQDYETPKLIEQLKQLSEETKIHEYTLSFYLLFVSAKRLYGIYEKQQLSEDIFFNTMHDLVCKLNECKAVHGIWGTFVFRWYPPFYRMKRFGLGRLQYDITTYEWEPYTKHGVSIKPGDTVYKCHIPSNGPLTKKARTDSYKKAFEFFKCNPLVIICDAWLLYPPHKDFLPQHLNIVDFMDDFDIISYKEEPMFSNAWRVFGASHTADPSLWPRETSLQRAYAERVQQGLPTGTGQGILVFDGNNIITAKQHFSTVNA